MKAWEDNIRRVEPYVPGEQPKAENVVKLNTNENPYPPSPMALNAIQDFKDNDFDSLRKYPDPSAQMLVDSISKFYGIDSDQVFVGVGSDDVISMCFLTFFNSKKPIFFPDITYSFYDVWAELYRIPYECKALDEDFSIIPSDYYGDNGGVIFPNPNAPTAKYMELDKVEDIIKHNQDVVVIIDEAYIDFGGKSAIDFVNKYENVLVVQTFSKSRAMAGMRIGYCFGSKSLIKSLNDVKFSFNSYTMNQTSLSFGSASVEDKEYFEETVEKIVKTRERAKVKLAELGFSFPDSKANFIFAKHESVKAEHIFIELKKRNIYVRYFKKPRIDNYLRITIGTDEEMEILYKALEEIINGSISE